MCLCRCILFFFTGTYKHVTFTPMRMDIRFWCWPDPDARSISTCRCFQQWIQEATVITENWWQSLDTSLTSSHCFVCINITPPFTLYSKVSMCTLLIVLLFNLHIWKTSLATFLKVQVVRTSEVSRKTLSANRPRHDPWHHHGWADIIHRDDCVEINETCVMPITVLTRNRKTFCLVLYILFSFPFMSTFLYWSFNFGPWLLVTQPNQFLKVAIKD